MKILHILFLSVLLQCKCGKWLIFGVRSFLVTNSTIEAIFSLLQNLSQEHAQYLAAICWSLWKHCNLKFWKNENELCANVIDRVVASLKTSRILISFVVRVTMSKPLQLCTRGSPCRQASRQLQVVMCIGKGQHRVISSVILMLFFLQSMNRVGIGICVRATMITLLL